MLLVQGEWHGLRGYPIVVAASLTILIAEVAELLRMWKSN
jgi:hypothetical protein